MNEARELERKSLDVEEARHRLDIAASEAILRRIATERAYYDALDEEDRAVDAYNSFIGKPLDEQEALAEAERIFLEGSISDISEDDDVSA